MKTRYLLPILLAVLLFPLQSVWAQNETLKLSLSRDFGYGGFNGDIQGTFSLHASGPADLTRVDFFLDDQLMGTAAKPPFALQFLTDNYPLGNHTFHAVGTLSSGATIKSNIIGAVFVPASASNQIILEVLGLILVIVLGSVGLAVLVPILTGRKTEELAPGTPRNYLLGGAVCRQCGRPFAFHIYGVRLGFGRLERCPYCGKWSFAGRASIQALRAAEQAELVATKGKVAGPTEEDKTSKEIDNSRYQDL